MHETREYYISLLKERLDNVRKENNNKTKSIWVPIAIAADDYEIISLFYELQFKYAKVNGVIMHNNMIRAHSLSYSYHTPLHVLKIEPYDKLALANLLANGNIPYITGLPRLQTNVQIMLDLISHGKYNLL